jgi:hypothetical protein
LDQLNKYKYVPQHKKGTSTVVLTLFLYMGSSVSSSSISQATPAMPPPGKSFAAFANVCCPSSRPAAPFANRVIPSGLLLGYIKSIKDDSLHAKTELGTEHMYRKHYGNKLDKIIVGYTGGKTTNPSYRQVCSGTTGHAESIQITFDPKVVSYESLVDFFFRMHGIFPLSILPMVLST